MDVYLMVCDEQAWAKRGAKRAGDDPELASAKLVEHYWSAWTAFLSANAALQLVAKPDLSKIATMITEHAYNIDAFIWNLTHGGERIANDYTQIKEELETLRGAFT